MFPNHFPIEAYEFLRRFEFFRDQMDLQWLTSFTRMMNRKWIYVFRKGEKLSGLAGAYKIKHPSEAVKDHLPEKEEGDILFISFFASQSENTLAALKCLKAYLRRNPDVRSIMYYRKSRGIIGDSYQLVHRTLGRNEQPLLV